MMTPACRTHTEKWTHFSIFRFTLLDCVGASKGAPFVRSVKSPVAFQWRSSRCQESRTMELVLSSLVNGALHVDCLSVRLFKVTTETPYISVFRSTMANFQRVSMLRLERTRSVSSGSRAGHVTAPDWPTALIRSRFSAALPCRSFQSSALVFACQSQRRCDVTGAHGAGGQSGAAFGFVRFAFRWPCRSFSGSRCETLAKKNIDQGQRRTPTWLVFSF